MDRELLIEIGVEELPAGWMPALTRQLAEHVGARLTALRIASPGVPIESFSTPRRLTARVGKIAERQEDLRRDHQPARRSPRRSVPTASRPRRRSGSRRSRAWRSKS